MDKRTEIAAMCLQKLKKAHKAIDEANAILDQLIEEHPKQRLWKVGDRVRITKCLNGHKFKIGKIVELKQFNDRDEPHIPWAAAYKKGRYWWISESEAELITD